MPWPRLQHDCTTAADCGWTAADCGAIPADRPHLYSAAWSGEMASSATKSGGRAGGALGAVAAGARGLGDATLSKGAVPRMKLLRGVNVCVWVGGLCVCICVWGCVRSVGGRWGGVGVALWGGMR